ncbi:sterol methyltransferase family protein [Pseudomonas fluorescens]|uniref:sterol methyltransferase family protein n=1 Tax=Pseudomonas fluorescens TaxID=294 RepID=UPI001BE6E7B2|nr:methyltransferase domain-containing protein [Pseudomonas fluorescens]MBT2375342.1 methyltransferase domain-containing protein [Pseudomonas fluorescens]
MKKNLESGSKQDAFASYLTQNGVDSDQRRIEYQSLVNQYYDLATDFYEFGWGQSFHFAPRHYEETVRESLVRHQHWLAQKLKLSQLDQVVDVGCGIGGPMRGIARFAGCRIIGVNINAYQVRRARLLNERSGLSDRCKVIEADFMKLPFPDASLEAAYAIEATVHAPSLTGVYSEVKRVLRPGRLWGTYEWCMTAKFIPGNTEHEAIKRQIEMCCGIPYISTSDEILRSIEDTNLDLLHVEDRAQQDDVPWWEPLAPSKLSLSSIRSSPTGSFLTNFALRTLEPLRLVPKGTASVGQLLALGARALVAGGKSGIFTPSLFVLAQKRIQKES